MHWSLRMVDMLTLDYDSGPSVLEEPTTPFAVLCNNSKTRMEDMPSTRSHSRSIKYKIMLSTGEHFFRLSNEFLVTENGKAKKGWTAVFVLILQFIGTRWNMMKTVSDPLVVIDHPSHQQGLVYCEDDLIPSKRNGSNSIYFNQSITFIFPRDTEVSLIYSDNEHTYI